MIFTNIKLKIGANLISINIYLLMLVDINGKFYSIIIINNWNIIKKFFFIILNKKFYIKKKGN